MPTARDSRAAPHFVEATNLIAAGPLSAGRPNTVLVEVANRTAQPSHVTVTVAAPAHWAVGRSRRTIPAFSSAIVPVLVIPPRAPTTATPRALVRAPGRTVYGVETADVTTIRAGLEALSDSRQHTPVAAATIEV